MNNNILFILILLIGSYFSLRKGSKEWDKELYYSLNIRYIGVGIMMLIATIVIIIKELNK